jgi:hypothetical protein
VNATREGGAIKAILRMGRICGENDHDGVD